MSLDPARWSLQKVFDHAYVKTMELPSCESADYQTKCVKILSNGMIMVSTFTNDLFVLENNQVVKKIDT